MVHPLGYWGSYFALFVVLHVVHNLWCASRARRVAATMVRPLGCCGFLTFTLVVVLRVVHDLWYSPRARRAATIVVCPCVAVYDWPHCCGAFCFHVELACSALVCGGRLCLATFRCRCGIGVFSSCARWLSEFGNVLLSVWMWRVQLLCAVAVRPLGGSLKNRPTDLGQVSKEKANRPLAGL